MSLKKLRSNLGQGSVEFAVTCIFYFFLIFWIIDAVGICYNWVSLQFAVNEAARNNSMGYDAVSKAQGIATSLGIPATNVEILDSTGTPVTGAGDPLTFVRLRVRNTVTLNPVSSAMLHIVGVSRPINVAVEALIRNEPFD